jgi:hypothetical protein
MLLSSGFIALHLNVFMADVVIPIIWEERAATSNTNQFLRTVLTEDAWIVISVELTSTGNRCGVAPSPINSTLKQTHQTRSQLYIDEFLLLKFGGGGVQWKHLWSRHNIIFRHKDGVTREVVETDDEGNVKSNKDTTIVHIRKRWERDAQIRWASCENIQCMNQRSSLHRSESLTWSQWCFLMIIRAFMSA